MRCKQRVWVWAFARACGCGVSSPRVCSVCCSVLRCDVNGRVVMKAFLSGMPDVKLGLNDKLEVRRDEAVSAGTTQRLHCAWLHQVAT